VLVAVCCTFVIFLVTAAFCTTAFGKQNKKKAKGFSIILTFFLSHGVPPVPSGPPRKVEVEAVNSSSIKVIWRSPMPTKQHGQIRGYQVHYVRMVNGEPTGQPVIKDILIDDAQVRPIPPATTSLTHKVRFLSLTSADVTEKHFNWSGGKKSLRSSCHIKNSTKLKNSYH